MGNDMNRRGFLKALTGGGALIAASQLPSFAKDDPLVFPQRGKWERLSVGYVRIDAGATKPFSVSPRYMGYPSVARRTSYQSSPSH